MTNVKNEHKHAVILRAIADGKTVQWKNISPNNPSDWVDASKTVMYLIFERASHIEWRIKPEPKPDVVTYDYVRGPTNPSKSFDSVEEAKKHYASKNGNAIVRLVWDGEDPTKLKSSEIVS